MCARVCACVRESECAYAHVRCENLGICPQAVSGRWI